MATTGSQNPERLPENLKKQLALAVRSIQWSYAIFWTISATQPEVLEWGDGYYNGEIKTRKTIQAVDFNSDQLGLQRSEQLRELYESLSAAESRPQAIRRPSAALSPEDLTDTEWYYLVCMSFVFNIDEGLPGRALANNQPIWLCNAHYEDSKVFSRSLLAKSASVQTVLCIPFLKGVIELGVTELVLEESGLIQHIKTSFLDIQCPMISNKSSSGAGNKRSDEGLACAVLGSQIPDNTMVPIVGYEVLEMASSGNSSNGIEDIGHNQPADDAFMVDGINGATSQVQSWQFLDDEFSNCVHQSMNSSECISRTFVDAAKVVSNPKEVQECNHTKLTSLDPQVSDLRYQSVLSSLIKTSDHQLVSGPHFQNRNQESSFVSWKKGGLVNCKKQRDGIAQKLLKKILFEVPRMNYSRFLESPGDDDIKDHVWRPEADDIAANLMLLERRRSEKLNQRFVILKSMLPSISKVEKVSILDDTIEYLQELQRKVQELESCRAELEVITKRKPKDTVERTSDNYGIGKIRTSNAKKSLVNKRKARDTDEMEQGLDNISVSMNENDVQIEIKCPWREGILLEFVDAISNLHLDSHWVQSSTNQGILSITIKTKYMGSHAASIGMIKQSLQRVAWNC